MSKILLPAYPNSTKFTPKVRRFVARLQLCCRAIAQDGCRDLNFTVRWKRGYVFWEDTWRDNKQSRKTKMKVERNALAYSATTVAASLMNAVFQFYYVNMFLNVHQYVDIWINNELRSSFIRGVPT